MMKRLSLALFFALWIPAAPAAIVEYSVSVNTAPVQGTNGSLFFDFNPGLGSTDPGTASILNFTTNGTLTPPVDRTAGVTGALPATVVIPNTDALNYYQTGFTFGSSLSFVVRLDVAVSGTAQSGSVFDIVLIDENGNPLLTTNPDGFLASIQLSPRGAARVDNYSSSAAVTFIPEPGTVVLSLLGLSAMLLRRRG